MVGALYKIISKILSSRLKEVIAPLIDESQSAFVMNRQILDGALIANESLRWLRKKKIPGTLIKLYFQKAYDSVNWDFLELVMEKLGFGRTWIKWIMNCVTSASMSILLNGSPLKPFKMEKGLRQGDPYHHTYLSLLVKPWYPFWKKQTPWIWLRLCKLEKRRYALNIFNLLMTCLYLPKKIPCALRIISEF